MGTKISFYLIALTFLSNVAYTQDWKAYSDSATLAIEKKETDKAIRYLETTKGLLATDSAATRTYTNVVSKLGTVYFETAKYRDAEKYFLEEKNLNERLSGKSSSEYISSSNNLAVLYRILGEFDKSESFALESNKLIEEVFGREHLKFAHSCNTLGTLYLSKGDLEKAQPYLVSARDIRKKLLGDHQDYATSCNNLAIMYVYMGEPDQAIPLYLESKIVRGKTLGTSHPDYAASCNNLGDLYTSIGKFKDAEALLLEAKDIRAKTIGKKHPEYAYTCNNLARLYNVMGEYDKCEQYYVESSNSLSEVYGKNHPSYATAMNNLGILYLDLGQLKKAEELFSLAKEIREKKFGKSSRDYADCCNNLGNLYIQMEMYDKAEAYHLEASQIRAELFGKTHPVYARTCFNLANVYYNRNEYPKALDFYNEARVIIDSAFGTDNFDYGKVIENLAVVYGAIGDSLRARQYFDQSRSILLSVVGENHPGYLKNCNNQAVYLWNKGDHSAAHQKYMEYFEKRKELTSRVFQFTSAAEQEQFNAENEINNQYLYSFLMNAGQEYQGDIYKLSISNRNAILSNSTQLQNAIRKSNNRELIDKFHLWSDVREELAFWLTKPIDERASKDSILEQQANILEKELSRGSADFKSKISIPNTTWHNIQEALKDHEASIEFVEVSYYNGRSWTDSTYYVAMILRKNMKQPAMIKLFEQRQLDSLLRFRGTSGSQHLISYLYNQTPGNNSPLYNLIWKPLHENLSGVSTIYFAPAGKLYKLAFSAIKTADGRSLSEKYKLVQLNSTATLPGLHSVALNPSDKIDLYGGVQYDMDSASLRSVSLKPVNDFIATRSFPGDIPRDGVTEFSYLEGSEKEVKRIQQLASAKKLSIKMYNGIRATEEIFKSASDSYSPSVVHIATHGYFFPDNKNRQLKKDDGGISVFKQSDKPLIRSGLALAGANNVWKGHPIAGFEDGILTAYEISNMYLPNTRLAVLSACETGLGDIQGSEGVYGLQRAFKMAGVENLLMSLWKVPDQETSEFMEKFYQQLFAGKPIQESFHSAQSAMQTKYRTDPYKWAAWILVR